MDKPLIAGVASDEARAATASRPSPSVLGQAGIANAEDALKAAFLKGWDACWCRKPNAPFERDGGRQTAWEKHRAAITGEPLQEMHELPRSNFTLHRQPKIVTGGFVGVPREGEKVCGHCTGEAR